MGYTLTPDNNPYKPQPPIPNMVQPGSHRLAGEICENLAMQQFGCANLQMKYDNLRAVVDQMSDCEARGRLKQSIEHSTNITDRLSEGVSKARTGFYRLANSFDRGTRRVQ